MTFCAGLQILSPIATPKVVPQQTQSGVPWHLRCCYRIFAAAAAAAAAAAGQNICCLSAPRWTWQHALKASYRVRTRRRPVGRIHTHPRSCTDDSCRGRRYKEHRHVCVDTLCWCQICCWGGDIERRSSCGSVRRLGHHQTCVMAVLHQLIPLYTSSYLGVWGPCRRAYL